MKKDKNCPLKLCALNVLNKEHNLQKYLKQFILGTVAVVLVAIIVALFVGFNTGFDNANAYTFNSYFHTEITENERADFASKIEKILTDNNVKNYELVQLGSTHDSGINIMFSVRKNVNTETLFEKLLNEVEETLKSEVSYLELTDIVAYNSAMTSRQVWLGVLGVALALVATLVYVAIRFDLTSIIALAAAQVNGILLLVALAIVFRVPVSVNIFIGLISTMLFSTLLATNYFVKIKDGFVKETNLGKTNRQIANQLGKENFKLYLLLAGVGVVLGIALMATATSLGIEFGYYVWMGPLVVIYSTYAFVLPLWSKLFKRESDKRLQKRLAEKNAPKQKEEKLEV